MREILFRGKREDNGEWVYGVLIHRKIWESDILIIREYDYGFDSYEESEVVPETVGQYTGITDKNGKKIFEGDIVSFAIFDYEGSDTQYKGVIKWADAGFYIHKDNESEFYGSDGGFNLAEVHYQDDEFEIIGNIYDNPELLRSDTE